MLGELAVLYLFLGGAGAGCVAACALADLLWLREPFGADGHGPELPADPDRRAVALGFATGLAALAAGVACLGFDLGRIDRVLALFLTPQLTVMTVGAWSLVALVAVALVLAAVRFLYLPQVGRPVVAVLEVAAVVLGVVVMAYTGLLLQGLHGFALWRSLWLPALFALSSASSGAALLMLCAAWASEGAGPSALMETLARVDAVVIVAEAVVAALFVGMAAVGDHPSAAASAWSLLDGPLAAAWWLGFCAVGLALPLAAEAACLLGGPRAGAVWERWPQLPVIAAAAVLAGAVCLRWAVVDAGMQRPLELQEPDAVLTLGDDAGTGREDAALAALDDRIAQALRADAPHAPGWAADEREGLIAIWSS